MIGCRVVAAAVEEYYCAMVGYDARSESMMMPMSVASIVVVEEQTEALVVVLDARFVVVCCCCCYCCYLKYAHEITQRFKHGHTFG